MMSLEESLTNIRQRMRITRKKIQKCDNQGRFEKKKKMLAKVEIIHLPEKIFSEIKKDFSKVMDRVRNNCFSSSSIQSVVEKGLTNCIDPSTSTDRDHISNLESNLNLIGLYEFKRPSAGFLYSSQKELVIFRFKSIKQFFPIRKPIHNRFQEKYFSKVAALNESFKQAYPLLKSVHRPSEYNIQKTSSEEKMEISSIVSEDFDSEISEATQTLSTIPIGLKSYLQTALAEMFPNEKLYISSLYESACDGSFHLTHKFFSRKLIGCLEGHDSDSNVEQFIWGMTGSKGLEKYFCYGSDILIEKKLRIWRKKFCAEGQTEFSEKNACVLEMLTGSYVSVDLNMISFIFEEKNYVVFKEEFKVDRKKGKQNENDLAQKNNWQRTLSNFERVYKPRSTCLTEDQIFFIKSFYPKELKKIQQIDNKKKICGFREIAQF